MPAGKPADASAASPQGESECRRGSRLMAVLVAISDLFFASKVAGTGLAFERAARDSALPGQVKARKPARLVVELGSRAFGGPVIDAIREIKADPETAGVEVVGYCRHTEIELIRAAKAAGADRVLTQGEFAELLPSLLDSGAPLPKGAASCE